MVVPLLAASVALAAVLVALVREAPTGAGREPAQGWEPLPAPADARRADFRLVMPGYDPAAVEAALAALADAYTDVLDAAPADVRLRAWRRACARRGVDEPAPGWLLAAWPESVLIEPKLDGAAEALRTEAALARLDQRQALRRQQAASA